jgi:hypothetical protein
MFGVWTRITIGSVLLAFALLSLRGTPYVIAAGDDYDR